MQKEPMSRNACRLFLLAQKVNFSKSQKAQKGGLALFGVFTSATQPIVDIRVMRLWLVIFRFNGFLCFGSSLPLDK